VKIEIKNLEKLDSKMNPLEIGIGKGESKIDLVDQKVEGVRICSKDGVELLFRITDPNEKLIKSGRIPSGSKITIPLEKGKDVYYIYFNNPAAWEVPEFLNVSEDKGMEFEFEIGEVEELNLHKIGQDAKWYDNNPQDNLTWDYRIPIKLINFSEEIQETGLVYINVTPFISRMGSEINEASIRVTDGSRLISHYLLEVGENSYIFGNSYQLTEDKIVFFEKTKVPGKSMHEYYVYFSTNKDISSISSDYYELLESKYNLAENFSFEQGNGLPTKWNSSMNGEDRLEGFGFFGKRCIKVTSSKEGNTGFWQDISVKPEKLYLYGFWIKGKGISKPMELPIFYKNHEGNLTEINNYKNLELWRKRNSLENWTFISGIFKMPKDISTFRIHLPEPSSGTSWYDGVVFAEVDSTLGNNIQVREDRDFPLTVWSVNPLVKVFQDFVPPKKIEMASISVARNEKEPLQLAVRSSRSIKNIKIEVESPSNEQGNELKDISVGIVSYVPIPYKSCHYPKFVPIHWYRSQQQFKTTPGASDGWAGLWPDPIVPYDTFSLKSNKTQPIWITLDIPNDAAPGDYRGNMKLVKDDKTLKVVPFNVRVWDFTLPEEIHLKAIYDIRYKSECAIDAPRLGPEWRIPGKSQEELLKHFTEFMAENRICPDRIYPEPLIDYEDRQVKTDYKSYNKAGEYYFEKLKLPHSYFPNCFYLDTKCPPRDRFGENPYPGKYSYESANPSELRTEFKTAYQSCLKEYWHHLNKLGWNERMILYVYDEPRFNPFVEEQIKAYCNMIHEVSDKILTYISMPGRIRTEWKGFIDVWGVHYGGPHYMDSLTLQRMSELRKTGDRIWFTIDGQICIDTPYCGVERLMPYFCLKYKIETYEYWGINKLHYNPWKFGWRGRLPNGTGYIAYPGKYIGYSGPVSSIRLEQVREGIEDYEYMYLLDKIISKNELTDDERNQAKRILNKAKELVSIPNAGGRFSTKILPDPDIVFRIRENIAKMIEVLE
jgi:hypothetical protein